MEAIEAPNNLLAVLAPSALFGPAAAALVQAPADSDLSFDVGAAGYATLPAFTPLQTSISDALFLPPAKPTAPAPAAPVSPTPPAHVGAFGAPLAFLDWASSDLQTIHSAPAARAAGRAQGTAPAVAAPTDPAGSTLPAAPASGAGAPSGQSSPQTYQPPVVTDPGPQTNAVGDSVRLQIQASDPNGFPLGYAASSLPSGLSIDANTGLISGTVAPGDDTGSPYLVLVSVSDGTGTTRMGFSWTITAAARSTIQLSGGGYSGVEGASAAATLATFTDSDGNTNAAAYGATVNWGDGQTTAATVQPNGGGFQVVGGHAYAEEGSFPVTVNVSDTDGASASAQETATVADAALSGSATSLSASAGQSFTAPIAYFNDADPGGTASDYAVTIDWGDGSSSTGTVVNAPQGAAGKFQVNGTHTYALPGSYSVAAAITDAGGGTVTTISGATITPPSNGPGGLTVVGVPASFSEGSMGSATVATFSDPDKNVDPSRYVAVIDWGDGSQSAGTITAAAGGGFQVSGGNAYGEEGAYTAAVTVYDADGASGSATSAVAVQDASLTASPNSGPPQTAVLGQSFTGLLGTFTDLSSGAASTDYTVTINWGDGTPPTSGTATPLVSSGWDVASGATFAVNGSHVYSQAGSHTVQAVTTDQGGSATTIVTSVQAAASDLAVNVGALKVVEISPFSVPIATFSDADNSSDPSRFTAIVDWGDGAANAPAQVVLGPGGYQVIGNHTYGDEGDYKATLTLRDLDGAAASVLTFAVGVDDPVESLLDIAKAGGRVRSTFDAYINYNTKQLQNGFQGMSKVAKLAIQEGVGWQMNGVDQFGQHFRSDKGGFIVEKGLSGVLNLPTVEKWEDSLKSYLTDKMYTNIKFQPVSFVSWQVAEADKNPRNGNVVVNLNLKMLVTADAAPGSGNKDFYMLKTIGAGNFTFHDGNVETADLRPGSIPNDQLTWPVYVPK